MPNNIVERATHYTLRQDKVQAQVLQSVQKPCGAGLESGLVGTRINPSPLFAHLDPVLDLVEAGISERTILRGKIGSGPRQGPRPRLGFLLRSSMNFERLRSVLHCILFRSFGMRYGPAILIWIVAGMASVY
jgi:hypothetical protein